jgi:hypothetical protein
MAAPISASAPLNDIIGSFDDRFLQIIRGATDDHSGDEPSVDVFQQQRVLMQDLME